MSANDTPAETDDAIRTTYEEYTIRGERVAMIADPDAAHAWIQSDVTVTVDP